MTTYTIISAEWGDLPHSRANVLTQEEGIVSTSLLDVPELWAQLQDLVENHGFVISAFVPPPPPPPLPANYINQLDADGNIIGQFEIVFLPNGPFFKKIGE